MGYERIKCHLCESDFGQESRFTDHLVEIHDIDVDKHIATYLERTGTTQPKCACSSSCETNIPWNGWKKGFTSKYARGHNARVDSVYFDKDRQSEFAKKRKPTSWNKGLRKETDERVANAAKKVSQTILDGYQTGRIVDWRVADPEKAAIAAKKLSNAKKEMFSKGELTSWNQGLSKETDERIRLSAEKISQSYNDNSQAGRRIKREELEKRIGAFSDKFTLVSSLDDYEKRRVSRLVFTCNKCGQEQHKSLAMLEESPVCFLCNPKSSKAELEIFEYVQSFGFETLSGDREQISPKELDVFVPKRRFAIEFNGLYWHSEAMHPDPIKHQQRKVEACRDRRIDLMSVFEDDWRDKQDIVKAMISHRMGESRRFQARKLRLGIVDKKASMLFFDENHLDGNVRSEVTFGLFAGEVLVSAMSLRKPFHRVHKEYREVARSCCLRGVSVAGWLGRLSKACLSYSTENGSKGIITYVDSRVGDGWGYKTSGWRLMKLDTGPRFWWTDFVNRFDRFSVRADRTNNVTQKQVADEAGVVRIFGSSNSMWIMEPV